MRPDLLTLLPYRQFGLALLLAVPIARAAVAEEPVPGPWADEFSVAAVPALLRPAVTRRIFAPLGGRYRAVAAPGPVAAGEVLGRFEDAELRATFETANLRLQAARQQEADYLAEAPARRQEAQTRATDLEGRVALAEAVAKDPALLRDLPAAAQALLLHADPAGLRAQLAAARSRLAQLDAAGPAEVSPARLQVREAEHAVREAEARLRETAVAAPIAGTFEPAAGAGEAVVGPGQELGIVRDASRVFAAVPAFSPYLGRIELERTLLRIVGPGGRAFDAPFREVTIETTPVMGETRVLLFAFSAEASRELANLVQTNVEAHVVLKPTRPVVTVAKLPAALAHPDAFHDGWAAGVPRAWPGWVLVCEGETALGLDRAKR